MTDFHLLRPYWLLAVIPVVLLWLQYRKESRDQSRFKDFIDPNLLEHLLVGQTEDKKITPRSVLFVLLFLVIIALSGPTFRQEPSPFAGDDAGLMVLMKLSSSMNNKDIQPSRLERAKQKLRDMLELRKGKSTGLIVYSGSSHLVMPLTTDGQVITTMIEDLTPELMPKDGDDLSGALSLGERMVNQSEKPGSIVIMADTIASSEQASLEKRESAIAVQIHSFNPIGSDVDTGIAAVSDLFATRPVETSLDTSDVETIVKGAATALTQITDSEKGQRWRDDGYWLLPFIAAFFLLWFRKGWVVR